MNEVVRFLSQNATLMFLAFCLSLVLLGLAVKKIRSLQRALATDQIKWNFLSRVLDPTNDFDFDLVQLVPDGAIANELRPHMLGFFRSKLESWTSDGLGASLLALDSLSVRHQQKGALIAACLKEAISGLEGEILADFFQRSVTAWIAADIQTAETARKVEFFRRYARGKDFVLEEINDREVDQKRDFLQIFDKYSLKSSISENQDIHFRSEVLRIREAVLEERK